MAKYEVLVVVAMSRFIEADSDEQARELAASEARAVAAEMEDHDHGGAAIAHIDTILRDDNDNIDLGELEGRSFTFDGDEFHGDGFGTRPEREMERDQNDPDQT